MTERELPEHVAANRRHWDAAAAEYVGPGERSWAREEPTWGIWCIPEAEVHLLPDDLAGRDVIELGCGTAYVSAWLERRGARPVGIDNSPAQLETARRLQREHGLDFPLHLGNAEATPFPDASFDLAISEYGAALWCDPYAWIPEAARLLRPGGELIFLTNAALCVMCMPETDAEGPATPLLRRPYFGMHRMQWPEEEGVEFHLGHGDWIQVLRANGFEVTDLVELRPGPDARTSYPWMSLEWARQWPSEEVWKARRADR